MLRLSTAHWCRRAVTSIRSCSLTQLRYARLIVIALSAIAILCGLATVLDRPVRSCLVLYTWNISNSAHSENFNFFLKEGIVDQPGVEYWIVLHNNPGTSALPPLPASAKYVVLSKPCQPWGALRSLLENNRRFPQHTYYVLLDSAVQGPFMAPYAKRAGSWIDALTSRITDRVKLVGSVISCDIAALPAGLANPLTWRTNPHVDTHVMATDKVGLQLLLSQQALTLCYAEAEEAAFHAGVGASLALLQAGYSLDSLMLRYQGVDWRDKKNWDCNGRISPMSSHHYDGISLDPFEVMFVKMEVPDHSRTAYTFNAVQAYKRWVEHGQDGPPEPSALSVNHVLERPMQHKLGHVCHLLTRTSQCFDWLFYRAAHSDLASISSPRMLWVHFLFYGQFEARAHRFNCTASHWAALDM